MFLVQSPNKKAVAYYRHSAEDKQENSVEIQHDHTVKFASDHNIEIIYEEADEGKTGLVADRPAFDRLFSNWIFNPNSPQFDYVLVYDVSRWGRWQDTDEAAYYEMLCKKQGYQVIYVTHGFPREEDKLLRTLQTPIERYMAAEYSRQLSGKVFHGCKKVSAQGFSAGGTACYGMARLLLDENKKPLYILKPGDHKAIDNQRVTFTPANDQTTETVKEIFQLFVEHWLTPSEIADVLNAKGIPSATGGKWNRDKIIRILTNETYIGSRIYNKTWRQLKQKQRNNPRHEWVICDNAFEAIIQPQTFAIAQERLYWLMPSRHKRGIYLSRKVRHQAQKSLSDFLDTQGFGEDIKKHILQRFPFIVSTKFYHGGTTYYCFLINEEVRQHKAIFGLSMEMDAKEPLSSYFFIPTADFGLGNYLVFSERDERYVNYQIKAEEVEEKVLSLCHSSLEPYRTVSTPYNATV